MKVNLCYHLIIIFLLITMFFNFREDYLRIFIIIHFLNLIDQFIIINLFYLIYMCLLLFIFKYLMFILILINSQFLKFIKDFSFKISNLFIINFINNQKFIFLSNLTINFFLNLIILHRFLLNIKMTKNFLKIFIFLHFIQNLTFVFTN